MKGELAAQFDFNKVLSFKCRMNNFFQASSDFVHTVRKMFQDKKLPPTKRNDLSVNDIYVVFAILLKGNNYSHNPSGLLSFLNPRSGEEIIVNEAIAIDHVLNLLDIRPFDQWVNWYKSIQEVSEFFDEYIHERLKERGLVK